MTDRAPLPLKILQCLPISWKTTIQWPKGIYQVKLSLTFTLLYLANLSLVHSGLTGLLVISLNIPYTILPWGLCHLCSFWLHPLPPSIHMWLTPSLPSGFHLNSPPQRGILWIPNFLLFISLALPSTSFLILCCYAPYHLLCSIKYIPLIYFVYCLKLLLGQAFLSGFCSWLYLQCLEGRGLISISWLNGWIRMGEMLA